MRLLLCLRLPLHHRRHPLKNPNVDPDTLRALEFYIERSCRYHSRREAWFDNLHRITMGISLLAGSSAFAAFSSSQISDKYGAIASAIVAILTTTNLVIGFSHKARDHQMMYRRFKQLAIDLLDQKISKDDDLTKIERKKLLIESDEPPIYRALDASCFNEVVRSISSDADYILNNSLTIKFRHKLFMHLVRFSENEFRPSNTRPKTT